MLPVLEMVLELHEEEIESAAKSIVRILNYVEDMFSSTEELNDWVVKQALDLAEQLEYGDELTEELINKTLSLISGNVRYVRKNEKYFDLDI